MKNSYLKLRRMTLLLISASSVLFVAGCPSSVPEPPARQPPTADGLQDKINKGIPGANVTAAITDKTVTLNGSVRYTHEVGIATSIAQGASPGYSISNKVAATSGAAPKSNRPGVSGSYIPPHAKTQQ